MCVMVEEEGLLHNRDLFAHKRNTSRLSTPEFKFTKVTIFQQSLQLSIICTIFVIKCFVICHVI
jgi:hypothetical protein